MKAFQSYITKRQGFTIVELLIVIVVIGILATIAIVAYNGFQARARNAKTASAASAYIKGLSIYAAINQSYPASGDFTCLGLAYCRGGTWAGSSSFDTSLKSVMGAQLPAPGLSAYNDNASSGSVALAYLPSAVTSH